MIFNLGLIFCTYSKVCFKRYNRNYEVKCEGGC